MTFHIYNGDKVVENLIFEINKVKGQFHNPKLDEALDKLKDNQIQCINQQANNIEIRGVLKQRINTFRADQLETTDIRRWWSETEYINIARSIPRIEEFLKEIYGTNYQTLVNKLVTYKSIMNDIKYRMDIQTNSNYKIENPEQAKFIHETERIIAKVQLTNEEVKKIGLLLDMFTSMGDMTVPSTTLQQARAKNRKIEYEQQDRRETAREYIIGGEQ